VYDSTRLDCIFRSKPRGCRHFKTAQLKHPLCKILLSISKSASPALTTTEMCCCIGPCVDCQTPGSHVTSFRMCPIIRLEIKHFCCQNKKLELIYRNVGEATRFNAFAGVFHFQLLCNPRKIVIRLCESSMLIHNTVFPEKYQLAELRR
jgi:hypothetical protein